MGGVYVTYVVDVYKAQWHVVTLVWSFKDVKASWTRAAWDSPSCDDSKNQKQTVT